MKGAKNELQELVMQHSRDPEDLPRYSVEDERGPPHKREFSVSCYVPSPCNVRVNAGAFFGTKREAEVDAARRALMEIRGRVAAAAAAETAATGASAE